MKKLLLTTIIAFAFSCVSASAAMVMLDYIGETHVTSNNIERTLIATSDDGKAYNIAIRPLDEAITNSDGTVSIPLEYLFINNTKEDVYLKYNEYSNIFWDTTLDVAPRNMTAKIKDYGVVPAGVYSITLEVQAIDIETQDVATTSSFSLQFIVPTFHELNTYSAAPEIKVSAKDAFTKNVKIKNEVSPMIYIRSNTDWVLSVDTTDFAEAEGKFYIKTESASGKVTSRLLERALITPDTPEIIIARGIAPAENEFVSVEFSMENPDGGYIPAGDYNYKVKYILREGRDK